MSENKVYITGGYRESQLFALDRETGEREWKHELESLSEASPILVDQTIYLGDYVNVVRAVDAETGAIEWGYEDPDRINGSSPVVTDDRVFVASGYGPDETGRLHALSRSSGEELWRTDSLGGVVDAAPAMVDGSIYVACGGGYVYSISTDSGSIEWQFEMESDRVIPASTVAVDEGVVYLSGRNQSDDPTLFTFEALSGATLWRSDREMSGAPASPDDPRDISGSPTVVDGTLLVPGAYTSDGFLAVDPDEDHIMWESEPGPGFVSIFADGALYTGGSDGVYCFDAADGSTLWSFRTGDSTNKPPAVLDDELYVVNGETLYAFDEK